MDVKSDDGQSPHCCLECGQLVRACNGCGRLHRPSQEKCLTPRCAGRQLPPLQADWSAYAGGVHRRGVAYLARELSESKAPHPRWDIGPIPGSRAHAISAYGDLFLAVDHRLMRIPDRDKPQGWKNANLPASVRTEVGAVLAERGLLLVLTDRGACAYSPANLQPLGQPVAGTFAHQLAGCDSWWLFEGQGGGRAVLKEQSLQDLGEPCRNVGEVSMPAVPPVLCADCLYWGGADGGIYRLRAGEIETLPRPEGEVIAVVAADPPHTSAGVFALTRSQAHPEYALHFLEHDRSAYSAHSRVDALTLLPRLWVSERLVLLMIERDARHQPALRCYDAGALSRDPRERTWPKGEALLDGMLLQTSRGPHMILAITDSGGHVYITIHAWPDGTSRTLGRLAAARGRPELLMHRGSAAAIVRTQAGGKDEVKVVGWPL